MTNRGIVNISKRAAGVAAAAALAALLTACGSTGDDGGVVSGGVGSPSTPASSSSITPTSAVVQVVPPKPTLPGDSTVARPVSAGRTGANLAGSGTPANTHSSPTTRTSSSVPPLSGPVTFESVALSSPYNCAESGTSYYTAPNVAVAVDVTVLVTSGSLARNLVIAAPNHAPRGLSNTSQAISSTALGHGVWRATYRTFVSLYEPKYVPVTLSALQATAAGARYTIAFPEPLAISIADCHS